MTATLCEPAIPFARAKSASAHDTLPRLRVQRAVQQADLQAGAQHMFSLMSRHVSSDGFLVTDPANPTSFSTPGCIIPAPSYPASLPGAAQDYVLNWPRDAHLT